MSTYQTRVIKERDDLLKKIEKLTHFLLSDDAIVRISDAEREKMWRQLYAMLEYGKVLNERIAYFKLPA